MPPSALSEDTKALFSELGAPWSATWDGVRMYVFEGDPRGDTMLLALISSEDRGRGETVLAQVHELRQMAERLRLPVRLIVVAENTPGSGASRSDPISSSSSPPSRAGAVRRAGFVRADRIARDVLTAEILREFLPEAGCALHLAERNGGERIDWSRPVSRLRSLSHSQQWAI